MTGPAAALALLLAGAAAGSAPAAALEGTGALSTADATPQAAAAWRGWARPGAWSEILVRLPPANAAGTLWITASGGDEEVTAEVAMPRGAPTSVRMAVPAVQRLKLRAALPDGRRSAGSVGFRLAERPLLAWAVEEALPERNDRQDAAHLLAVSGADLPHLSSSYASVGGIAIDSKALGALQPAQLAALLGHVGACGFTILVGVTDQVRAILERAAGCAGRALHHTPLPLTPETALAAFAARQLPPAPSAAQLALAETGQQPRWLTAALLGYLALATVGLFSARAPALALALPAIATGAIGAALWLHAPRESLAIWAEAGAGDGVARYAAILQVEAAVPGSHAVELPRLLGRPSICGLESPARFVWNDAQARISQAVVPTRLLSRESLCFEGSFPVAAPYGIAAASASVLELRATAAAWDRPGWILWDGRVHAFAREHGVAAVRVRRDHGTWPATPVQRLAAERLAWNEAGVLVPLEAPSELGMPRTAWLLVRLPLPEQSST